jgi:hypothetical protein
MVHEALPFLKSMATEFPDDIIIEEFSPISIWFSYGSNLSTPDFEHKMREHGSSLSLLRPRPGTLVGWRRRLDNKSKTRGLAYAIKKIPSEPNSKVVGIVHDIPIGDLSAFLQFEGVLDDNFELKDKAKGRTYDIRRVSIELRNLDTPIECYTLEGISSANDEERLQRITKRAKDLKAYVRTAMKGSIEFGIEISAFQEDISEIERLSA